MASSGHRHAKCAHPSLTVDPLDMLSGLLPPHSDSDWRDWASLPAGPAGHIGELALANDVADYVRFRAVCAAWRACSQDPRASDVSDRRFHPWQWIMLLRAPKPRNRRRFLNIYTGEIVHAHIPDLSKGCYIVGTLVEGLLVLWHSHVLKLYNPLTGQLTNFPRADGMLTPYKSRTYGAGLADDSTVALRFGNRALAMAKPGDKDWTQLKKTDDYILLVLPFAGRLYCLTGKKILVLETAANQKPELVVVADLKLEHEFSWFNDYLYPVYDEGGDLILVHRGTTDIGHWLYDTFAAYKVKLDTGNVERIHDLGGQALFVCDSRSQSVAAKISSSIRADTIYICTNYGDYGLPKVVAFDLSGKITRLGKKDVLNYLFDYVLNLWLAIWLDFQTQHSKLAN